MPQRRHWLPKHCSAVKQSREKRHYQRLSARARVARTRQEELLSESDLHLCLDCEMGRSATTDDRRPLGAFNRESFPLASNGRHSAN
jgi:hypothetical protein